MSAIIPEELSSPCWPGSAGPATSNVATPSLVTAGKANTEANLICKHCGQESSKAKFILNPAKYRKAERDGFLIQNPCCLACFCRIKKRKQSFSKTPSDFLIEQRIGHLRHLCFTLGKESGIGKLRLIFEEIEALESAIGPLNSVFAKKRKEIQDLADRIAGLMGVVSNAKSEIEEKLSVSYPICRKIANRFTQNVDIREQVFKRDGFKCKLCGSTSMLTVDHIIPVFYGGPNTMINLQTLCLSCNCSKQNKLPKTLKEVMEIEDHIFA